MSDREPSVLLAGIDGANPLGFLAALGALRTLSLALPDEAVRMSWEQSDGAWRPRLWCSLKDVSRLVERLHAMLDVTPSQHPVMAWRAWMSKSAKEVQQQFRVAVDVPSIAEFTSAIGSDAAPPNEEEGIADNPFRAARTDYFIKNLTAIIERCTHEHLKRALAAPWDYADAMENQSLRLDASDDRRHAYQWSAPTLDDTRKMRGTMLGANRLAIESYVFFQSCMQRGRLATTAFGPKSKGIRALRWPLWNVPASADVVKCLIGAAECWNSDQAVRGLLASRGVPIVFESLRIKVGDSNPRTNFTPSRPV